MYIKEILNHLTMAELSQHKYGGYREGVMSDEDVPKVVGILNDGLKDINQHANLCRDNTIVRLKPWMTDYKMNKRFAITNTGSDVESGKRYILDSLNRKFDYDFRRIVSVAPANNVGNDVYRINERSHHWSIGIIKYDTFRIPFPKEGMKVEVEYEHHPRNILAQTMEEAALEELDMPLDILPALYAYVEEKMTAGLSVQQDIADDNAAMSRYMIAIQRLGRSNIMAGDLHENDNFRLRGWL